MDERSHKVLEAVIREYIDTAEPVGSFHLREEYDFPFSSATIRSVLSDLEGLGYIFQPHTSAGRVPTEKGYRFFVDLFGEGSFDSSAKREELAFRKKMLAMRSSFEKMLDATARLLTETSSNAGIAGTNEYVFKYGISNLLREPEIKNEDYAVGVADIFDNINDVIREVPDNIEVDVYVGGENPIGKKAGCSLVISRFLTPYNTKGFLGILGPTRMSYERNLSLVNMAKDILEGEI